MKAKKEKTKEKTNRAHITRAPDMSKSRAKVRGFESSIGQVQAFFGQLGVVFSLFQEDGGEDFIKNGSGHKLAQHIDSLG